MRRSVTSQIVAAVVLALVTGVAGACSSGDDGNAERDEQDETTVPAPDSWDDDAVASLSSLAERMSDAGVGCADFGTVDVKGYASLGGRNLTFPEAVGRCTALDEDVELSALPDADAAKDWVEERRAFLCKRAEGAGIVLPGFPYVRVGRMVLQPDGEPVGRRLAEALGATFDYARCEGARAGWDDAAAEKVTTTGKQIDEGGYDCADFELRDPDFTIDDFRRKGLPAPMAAGSCTSTKFSEGVSVVVAVIQFAQPQDMDAYVAFQHQADCEKQAGIPIAKVIFVQKGNLMVETRVPEQAQGIATLLGGELVENDAC